MMPKVSERPQLKFADKIDNSPSKPFEPIIKEKPNALKPLSVLLLHTDFGEW
jgi:exosome complex exonuclease RRP6